VNQAAVPGWSIPKPAVEIHEPERIENAKTIGREGPVEGFVWDLRTA